MDKLVSAFKKDPVLYISGILAALSALFVRPDAQYISYINFRVLAILLGLMLIVSACVRIGTFDYMTYCLLRKIRGQRHISILLVVMSFFLSMVSSVTGSQITGCLDFKIGNILFPIPVTLHVSPPLRWLQVSWFSNPL